MSKYYYYLHTNGDIIGKPPIVVESDPQYFNSPFVRKVWSIDTEDRIDTWNLVIEVLGMECKIDRARELCEKWNLTKEDSVEYLQRAGEPSETMKDGLERYILLVLHESYDEYWRWFKEQDPITKTVKAMIHGE